MYQTLKQRVADLLERGYSFDAGQFLNEGIEIARNYYLYFIGIAFTAQVVGYLFGMIPYGNYVYQLTIAPVLTAGMILFVHQAIRYKSVDFANFLKGFDQIGPIIIVNLILSIIMYAILIPSIYALYQDGLFEWFEQLLTDPESIQYLPQISGRTWGILFLNLLPLVYISVAYMWAYHFLLIGKMGPWEAIETSRKVITKEWFSVFVFALMIFGIAVVVGIGAMVASGVLGFMGRIGTILAFVVVGAVFALVTAVFVGGAYTAFMKIMDIESGEEEGEDFINHLVD